MSVPVTIGVLALQGAFAEHVTTLRSIDGVKSLEVKTVQDLEGLDGIVLPGGESTAISLIGDKNGIFGALKQWVERGNPVWGTCAGCIMLANDVQGQKQGGQGLIGGMDISVHRNFFGRQIASFETDIHLSLPSQPSSTEQKPTDIVFPGVFIRAPAILGIKNESGVTILGEITAPSITEQQHGKVGKVIVAAQQGPLLASVFHPELTTDKRFHEYFVALVREYAKKK